MELTKFDMTRARRSSPSQTCCSFFFLCSLLRLCWGFLSGLLLPNSPSPTRSRLEQVILTIGNGLPLRPVLVLPTWPGMPHRVNTWGCHAEQWVYPSNDTGANRQASKSLTEWTGGVSLPEQSMTDWGALSHSMPFMWWRTSSGHHESESVETYQLSLFSSSGHRKSIYVKLNCLRWCK